MSASDPMQTCAAGSRKVEIWAAFGEGTSRAHVFGWLPRYSLVQITSDRETCIVVTKRFETVVHSGSQMLDTILTALADPTIREWYTVFHFTITVLPMIGLFYWYYSGIRKTEGGRELLAAQARAGRGVHARIVKDIAAGRYGARVKQMTNRTYWLGGVWAIINLSSFGILFWSHQLKHTPN